MAFLILDAGRNFVSKKTPNDLFRQSFYLEIPKNCLSLKNDLWVVNLFMETEKDTVTKK
jgi:hypothetical protein